MQHSIRTDNDVLVEARFAQIRAEFDLRVIKWQFIYAIFTVALVAVLLLPTLRGPTLVVFLGGSAVQAYAVWRM